MFSPPPNYPPPPPGYVPYNNTFSTATPMSSPSPAGPHGYYPSPRYSMPASSPSPRDSPKGHSRRASGSYPSPGYATPGPGYYPGYVSPNANVEFVSSSDREFRRVYIQKSGGRRACQHCKPLFGDERQRYEHADGYIYIAQTPIHGQPSSQGRSQRSHSTRTRPSVPPRSQTAAPGQTQKPKVTQVKPPPKATDEDARRANIPAGYSIKNWDPNEVPILLLGSVFDANSLGKWIYDWTVYHCGPATQESDTAGNFWLLLIKLAGKVQRAQGGMQHIRKPENLDMVEDYIDAGERLWTRLNRLLKTCEEYMWPAAERKASRSSTGSKGKPQVQMGASSAREFINSIFGYDRELGTTEALMESITKWSKGFDANCEEILQNPKA